MADDELNILSAIFSLPGELTQWSDGEKTYLKVVIAEQCPVMKNHEDVIVFSLQANYPEESPPAMDVSGCLMESDKILDRLRKCAVDNMGRPQLLDLINFAKELVEDFHSSYPTDCAQSVTSMENTMTDTLSCEGSLPPGLLQPQSALLPTKNMSSCSEISQQETSCQKQHQERSPPWTLLLHIDHMRAKSKYIKCIKKWCQEFQLNGKLIFFKKSYLIQHKTVCVDVDSRGAACKEKMMTVLSEEPCLNDNLNTMPSGLQVLECSNVEEVEDIFTKSCSHNIFVNYVSKLKNIHRF
ncbi:RWD domain-containing protein 3-like, partial [Argonauta hians]